MKPFRKIACCLTAVGLATTPFSIQANEPTSETSHFQQSTQINQTVHELESLFVLMQERFALMHELAKYKWNAELQNEVLDAEELNLFELGLENDAFIISFLDAQNTACAKIQQDDFALFSKENHAKFEEVKDFDHEIYPQLRMINEAMIATVNQLLIHTQNESLPEFLKELSFASFESEGINREVYNIAVDPLFRD